MGEIVNLRRVKRTRAREEAAKDAAANRARHGMSKAERAAEAKRRALLEKAVDGAALEQFTEGELAPATAPCGYSPAPESLRGSAASEAVLDPGDGEAGEIPR